MNSNCDPTIQKFLLCSSDEKTLYLTPEQEKDKSHFTDKEVSAAEEELISGSEVGPIACDVIPY